MKIMNSKGEISMLNGNEYEVPLPTMKEKKAVNKKLSFLTKKKIFVRAWKRNMKDMLFSTGIMLLGMCLTWFETMWCNECTAGAFIMFLGGLLMMSVGYNIDCDIYRASKRKLQRIAERRKKRRENLILHRQEGEFSQK